MQSHATTSNCSWNGSEVTLFVAIVSGNAFGDEYRKMMSAATAAKKVDRPIRRLIRDWKSNT